MVGRFGFLVAPGWGEGRFLLGVYWVGGWKNRVWAEKKGWKIVG